MYIETNRLIIRELMEQEADALIAIKNENYYYFQKLSKNNSKEE